MDPIRTTIMRNRFGAIVEEASAILHRTAHTTFVKLVQDYQCALATPEGDMFAYPSQSGVNAFIGLSMKQLLDNFGRENLKPGDCLITNDPFSTGGLVTHLMDVTLVRPIFHEETLVAVAWSFVHASDIGGAVPGSISPGFTEVFQEGIRLRPMKLFNEGVLDENVRNVVLDNSRIPEDFWGDLLAMLSASLSMDKRVGELCIRYGVDMVREAMYDLIDLAEIKARSVIAKIPNGEYSFGDYLEGFGKDSLTYINVVMKVIGEEIELDFTGTDPQIAAAYNIVSGVQTHPYIAQALLWLILTDEPDSPRNAGLLRPIRSHCPQGTVLNAAFPAAGGCRAATSVRVSEAIMGCLNQALPGGLTAASSGMGAIIVVTARDPSTGKDRVNVISPICGGGGGRVSGDGVDGVDVRFATLKTVPMEMVEIETVIRVRRYALLEDGRAAGKHQGGAALVMELENTGFKAIMTVRNMNRFVLRPWGIQQGEPGRLGEVVVNPDINGGSSIGKIEVLHMGRGDVVRITTPAGGGYGDPLERKPELVVHDIAQDLLSVERAKAVYGVVLDAAGNLDSAATEQMRSRFSAERVGENPVNYGPERDAYDRIWPAQVRTQLAELAMAAEPSERQSIMKNVIQRFAQSPEAVTSDVLEAAVADALSEIRGTRRAATRLSSAA